MSILHKKILPFAFKNALFANPKTRRFGGFLQWVFRGLGCFFFAKSAPKTSSYFMFRNTSRIRPSSDSLLSLLQEAA